MDTVLERKQLIKSYLEEKLGFPNRYFPNLKDYVIIDEQQVHFIHLLMGWNEGQYVYQALRHLEVKEDGAIVIHQNNVDKPIDLELTEFDIPAFTITYVEEPVAVE